MNSSEGVPLERTSEVESPAIAVILGASNVTLGFPRIVSAVRRRFPQGVDIVAAHGHGRSFGHRSWAPFRTLPGIRECGLWETVAGLRDAAQRAPQVYALVTDVGNDLVYGHEPMQICGWVEECLGRLVGWDARIVLGRLPLESLGKMGGTRFRATRALFFPQSTLTFDRMRTGAGQLDELIAGLATKLRLSSFVPRPEWYGFDPIHIRRGHRSNAWRAVFSQWGRGVDDAADSPGLRASWRYWRLRPAETRAFGRPRSRQQPAWTWKDGGGLWLF